jgi:glucan 1,3-beta-glucosidase
MTLSTITLKQTRGLPHSTLVGIGEQTKYMGMFDITVSRSFPHDVYYSVNVGGLFVLEPFISPQLYQKYGADAVDEWTLSQLMAADTASGGLNQLENHYNTFITEQDIAEIAGAGLNWIRLPIPFWAIEVWDGEPFLAQVSWK